MITRAIVLITLPPLTEPFLELMTGLSSVVSDLLELEPGAAVPRCAHDWREDGDLLLAGRTRLLAGLTRLFVRSCHAVCLCSGNSIMKLLGKWLYSAAQLQKIAQDDPYTAGRAAVYMSIWDGTWTRAEHRWLGCWGLVQYRMQDVCA